MGDILAEGKTHDKKSSCLIGFFDEKRKQNIDMSFSWRKLFCRLLRNDILDSFLKYRKTVVVIGKRRVAYEVLSLFKYNPNS